MKRNELRKIKQKHNEQTKHTKNEIELAKEEKHRRRDEIKGLRLVKGDPDRVEVKRTVELVVQSRNKVTFGAATADHWYTAHWA